jgi:hypothetical protein
MAELDDFVDLEKIHQPESINRRTEAEVRRFDCGVLHRRAVKERCAECELEHRRKFHALRFPEFSAEQFPRSGNSVGVEDGVLLD